MSWSNMNGFVGDEQDKEHTEVFSESKTASDYLKARLPNDGDTLFFNGEDEWLQVVNKDGRFWIEIGEGAA